MHTSGYNGATTPPISTPILRAEGETDQAQPQLSDQSTDSEFYRKPDSSQQSENQRTFVDLTDASPATNGATVNLEIAYVDPSALTGTDISSEVAPEPPVADNETARVETQPEPPRTNSRELEKTLNSFFYTIFTLRDKFLTVSSEELASAVSSLSTRQANRFLGNLLMHHATFRTIFAGKPAALEEFLEKIDSKLSPMNYLFIKSFMAEEGLENRVELNEKTLPNNAAAMDELYAKCQALVPPVEFVERFRSVEILTQLVESRNGPLDPEKPVALLIYSKEDHNGSFSAMNQLENEVRDFISRGYQVVYYEVDKDTQLVDAFRETVALRNGAKIEFATLGGHGTQNSIQLGNSGNFDQDHLDISDWSIMSEIASYCAEDFQFASLGCSTGRGGKGVVNMATFIAEATGATVFAPTEIAYNGIPFQTRYTFDNATGRVIDVKFPTAENWFGLFNEKLVASAGGLSSEQVAYLEEMDGDYQQHLLDIQQREARLARAAAREAAAEERAAALAARERRATPPTREILAAARPPASTAPASEIPVVPVSREDRMARARASLDELYGSSRAVSASQAEIEARADYLDAIDVINTARPAYLAAQEAANEASRTAAMAATRLSSIRNSGTQAEIDAALAAYQEADAIAEAAEETVLAAQITLRTAERAANTAESARADAARNRSETEHAEHLAQMRSNDPFRKKLEAAQEIDASWRLTGFVPPVFPGRNIYV